MSRMRTQACSGGSNSPFQRTVTLLLIIALFPLLATICHAESSIEDPVANEAPSTPDRVKDRQCSIYIAPSSLQGHAGMGVYTVRDIAENEEILAAADGPIIPVVDSYANYDTLPDAQDQWHDTFNNYWWGRGVPDHTLLEGDKVFDYQITFGSLPNHHCLLDSIEWYYPDNAYDDSFVNPYTDPGAGAFSYHMGRAFYAKRDVKAGEELFLNYGACSRQNAEEEGHHDWAEHIPMEEDYATAIDVVKEWYNSLVQEHGTDNVPDLALTPAAGTTDQVAALLPKTTRQLLEIMSASPSNSSEHLSQQLARDVATTARTVEWIQENGICVEHLIPGRSRLAQAGQGGFSQHVIRQGEIVVPAPFLHIVDKDVLATYDDDGERVGTQLLMNYCFGHPESSLLLCPDTNAILINHCSNRTKECSEQGPNAEYRWSTGGWDADLDKWLNMTLDDMAKEHGRGLSMEIVALRDIMPGEEVFMDYGVEWEQAWAKHVANWKSSDDNGSFTSVHQANKDINRPLPSTAVSGDLWEETDDPYMFTACVYWPSIWDEAEVWSEEVDFDSLTDEELLERYSDDGSEYVQDYSTHSGGTYWPCFVLLEEERESDDDPITYTVRIGQRYSQEQMPWDENEVPRLLTNYPRESIRFFAKPYQSDQHLLGAFRHPISIRDDIFPTQWKNRKI